MLVYDIAKFINKEAGCELIPQSTITKAPSAELKPNQTDQDSLPPYPVLDAIINAYVEQHLNPDEIVKIGFDKKVVSDVIKLVDRNEYKRCRLPWIKSNGTGIGLRLENANSTGF